MTGPDARGAAAVLDSARPAVDRLDATRPPEATSRDLLEIWTAVESSLRALLGGSALAGQPLVREVRQRELISLEQAHAVLELLAVRERVDRGGYQAAASDVDVAREAYGALARGFGAAAAPAPLGTGPAAAPSAAPMAPAAPAPASSPNRGPAIVLAVLVLLVAAGGYYWYRRASIAPALQSGIAAYAAGRRDDARADFTRAAAADPRAASPHVYLARMAREDGDFTTAARELTTAVQVEPGSAAAQSELGAFFLARGSRYDAQQRTDLATQDYDAARRAYVRALQIAPADSAAQGYLGCALARLGRAGEAASWFARAGAGPWSACAAAAPPAGATASP